MPLAGQQKPDCDHSAIWWPTKDASRVSLNASGTNYVPWRAYVESILRLYESEDLCAAADEERPVATRCFLKLLEDSVDSDIKSLVNICRCS